MNIYWTPSALSAFRDIYEFIAADNETAAVNLFLDLEALCQRLCEHPQSGRPGRVTGTRESVFHPSYILVYRVKRDQLEIISIRHTSRQWPASF